MGAYSDDLLFIHIPKCAGTSIRQWLKQYVPGTIDFADEDSGLPIGHIPLKDIERFTGRAPSSFKKIVSVIRDPYTQQLSQWLFWRRRRERGGIHIHDVVAALHPSLTSWLHDARCDFHLWYESHWGSSETESWRGLNLDRTAAHSNRYPHYGGYYRYWLTIDGEPPPNLTLFRMEQLDQAWLDVVGDFATPDAPGLPTVNRGNDASDDREVAMPWYTPHAIGIVNDKFAWTFDRGWYSKIVPDESADLPMGPVI